MFDHLVFDATSFLRLETAVQQGSSTPDKFYSSMYPTLYRTHKKLHVVYFKFPVLVHWCMWFIHTHTHTYIVCDSVAVCLCVVLGVVCISRTARWIVVVCRFSLTCSHNHAALSLLTFCWLPEAASSAASSAPAQLCCVSVRLCMYVHILLI